MKLRQYRPAFVDGEPPEEIEYDGTLAGALAAPWLKDWAASCHYELVVPGDLVMVMPDGSRWLAGVTVDAPPPAPWQFISLRRYCEHIHCHRSAPHVHWYTPIAKAWYGPGFCWVADTSRLDRYVVRPYQPEVAV